jgi:hypothetical protein
MGVDPRVVPFLLGNIIVDFALSNRSVLVAPIEGLEEQFVDGFLKGLLPRAKLKRVRLVPSAVAKGDGTDLSIEDGERRASADELEEDGEPKLSILGAQVLVQGKGAKKQALEDIARALRTNSGLGFMVTRPTERRVSEDIRAVAGISMKVTSVNGTLLLQPDTRLQKLLAFDISRDSGMPILGLRSIE